MENTMYRNFTRNLINQYFYFKLLDEGGDLSESGKGKFEHIIWCLEELGYTINELE